MCRVLLARWAGHGFTTVPGARLASSMTRMPVKGGSDEVAMSWRSEICRLDEEDQNSLVAMLSHVDKVIVI